MLKERLVGKYFGVLNLFYTWIEKRRLHREILTSKGRPRIFLFSNPIHSNLGDQAQTYCILEWFRKYYPSHKVICIPKEVENEKILQAVREDLTNKEIGRASCRERV